LQRTLPIATGLDAYFDKIKLIKSSEEKINFSVGGYLKVRGIVNQGHMQRFIAILQIQ